MSEKKHKAIIEELKLRAEAQNIADGHGGESVLSSGEELSAEETAKLEEEAMQQLGTSVNASAAAEEAVQEEAAQEPAQSEDSTAEQEPSQSEGASKDPSNGEESGEVK